MDGRSTPATSCSLLDLEEGSVHLRSEANAIEAGPQPPCFRFPNLSELSLQLAVAKQSEAAVRVHRSWRSMRRGSSTNPTSARGSWSPRSLSEWQPGTKRTGRPVPMGKPPPGYTACYSTEVIKPSDMINSTCGSTLMGKATPPSLRLTRLPTGGRSRNPLRHSGERRS